MSPQYSGPLERIEIERRLLLFFHTVKTPLSPKAGEPVQHRETTKDIREAEATDHDDPVG
jgi:hypothetical protein